MAHASYSHETTVPARRPQVWQRLQEAATWAEIGPIEQVWDEAHEADGTLRSFRWSAHVAGRDIRGTADVTKAIPEQLLELELATSEVRGTLRADLAEGNSTALVVTMELQPRGMLGTLFFPIIARTIGDGLGDHVDDFAAGF